MTTVDVVILDLFEATRPLLVGLATSLRSRGFNVDHLYEASMKRAMRYLDRSGCFVGIMVGDREAASGVVRVIETLSAGWRQYDVPTPQVHEHYLFR